MLVYHLLLNSFVFVFKSTIRGINAAEREVYIMTDLSVCLSLSACLSVIYREEAETKWWDELKAFLNIIDSLIDLIDCM